MRVMAGKTAERAVAQLPNDGADLRCRSQLSHAATHPKTRADCHGRLLVYTDLGEQVVEVAVAAVREVLQPAQCAALVSVHRR